MKSRTREVNIFSIAALDLFASALGAFILMSLVFMVFFAMTAPEASQAEGMRAALDDCRVQLAGSVDADELERCKANLTAAVANDAALRQCREELADSVNPSELEQCKARFAAVQREITELEDTFDERRIPDLDIVICLDVTSSMVNEIEGLKRQIVELANVLDSLAQSTGIGIVTYGDHEYDQVTTVHPIVATRAMASLKDFVSRLAVDVGKGGGRNTTTQEAVEVGLLEATSESMDWRTETRRRDIIVITDAPPYGRHEATALDLARRFAKNGDYRVSTVMVQSRNPDRMHERTEPFLRELAKAGEGSFINAIQGQTMIASVLLAVLDST